MSSEKHLDFYLEPDLLRSAQAGQHNFIGKIVEVAEQAGFTTGFHGNSLQDRSAIRDRPGFSMLHMDEPEGPRSLTFRRVYHYPFWQIEPTTKRWDWRVAQKRFNAKKVDPKEAHRFYTFWRKRLFVKAAENPTQEGFVYVPLQGRLTERRSFQTCSPLEMLVSTLQHDPSRRIIATLHPNESYSASEMSKLNTLTTRFPRLTVQKADMVDMLGRCDYVVTQNSSAAFNGYFFGKPCVLFARVDFHHIAADVYTEGLDRAFATVQGELPDFERYVWWFWQEMSINAGRPEAKNKIRQALRRNGWAL
ncbi:hypothetical protein TG4357_01631 [Thalassovita gelatinovora]|uniref:Capsule polysaccharide biosynthesis protein n=1 Tax=Thalassovita gelatinovora TaxID=53501 RepID=A0A0P1FAC9_THAGE|nr:hypothetical protein [Thalassovita gelatinovora]QIZ81040.1 UDP-N-acetyl glucosamine 2-epimerase [Thalassovita gelatinovora]CUH65014.1 hypothetical protein TG4357_01631 [Thalassovita gelatinovora]SEP87938.1 hypothetical protein SAMN04488043_10244 [Thalassovita gelatinovora]